MSIKSYTLADGTTATVNATEQGIPFNEGMNVLAKAIKAKIEASSSGGDSSSSSNTFDDDNFADDNDMQDAIVDIFNGNGTSTTSDDNDMKNAIVDIFNGNSSYSSDPDFDSALDDIFNP